MASYRLKVAVVPGMEITLLAENVAELKQEYEHMGGDPGWFVDKLKEIVPATEHGEGVGALSATVFGDTVDLVGDPEYVEGEGEAIDEHGQEYMARGTLPAGGSEKPATLRDPWTEEEVPATPPRRSASRTAPSRGSSAPSSPAPSGGGGSQPVEKYDKWGNKFVVGLPNAPQDENGHGPMVLKTWTNQQGKEFTAFKCPNTAPGGDYQNKCDAHAWPPR